jgi:hypothetical protein
MKLSDLIQDAGTGMVSHTKVWANIAYATATVAFGYMVYKNTATGEIWMIYLGGIGASATLSKLLSLKYGGAAASTDSADEVTK